MFLSRRCILVKSTESKSTHITSTAVVYACVSLSSPDDKVPRCGKRARRPKGGRRWGLLACYRLSRALKTSIVLSVSDEGARRRGVADEEEEEEGTVTVQKKWRRMTSSCERSVLLGRARAICGRASKKTCLTCAYTRLRNRLPGLPSNNWFYTHPPVCVQLSGIASLLNSAVCRKLCCGIRCGWLEFITYLMNTYL